MYYSGYNNETYIFYSFFCLFSIKLIMAQVLYTQVNFRIICENWS